MPNADAAGRRAPAVPIHEAREDDRMRRGARVPRGQGERCQCRSSPHTRPWRDGAAARRCATSSSCSRACHGPDRHLAFAPIPPTQTPITKGIPRALRIRFGYSHLLKILSKSTQYLEYSEARSRSLPQRTIQSRAAPQQPLGLLLELGRDFSALDARGRGSFGSLAFHQT